MLISSERKYGDFFLFETSEKIAGMTSLGKTKQNCFLINVKQAKLTELGYLGNWGVIFTTSVCQYGFDYIE